MFQRSANRIDQLRATMREIISEYLSDDSHYRYTDSESKRARRISRRIEARLVLSWKRN